jgi:glycosyltransferase involved in cell wall biosynthesis
MNIKKPTCIIYAPIDSFSGYGARSRGIAKSLIELKKNEWDIKIISVKWGHTPQNFLNENQGWTWLKEYILDQPLTYKPNYMFWITIPSEAQAIGDWNCLITAGIETTVCAPQWIEGCNRMDLILTSSEHSKKVFEDSSFEMRDSKTNTLSKIVKLEKPIMVLSEEVDLDLYKIIPPNEFKTVDLKETLDSIPEKFCFLFVGMWIGGNNVPIGEDRKNISLLVKAFYETFKRKKEKPALLLKVNLVGSSYIDRREIQERIESIRKTVNGDKLPSIYILSGEFTDQEINEMYNHPKVKAMVSLTKGEGFGRPLLEFSSINKPIICSAWSGPLDFLKKEFCGLLEGSLTPIHPSAQVKDMLIEGSKWFSPDHKQIGDKLTSVFEDYKKWLEKAKRQGRHSRQNFSYDKLKENLNEILDEKLPNIPKFIPLNLPKINPIKLPSLTKINNE